MENKNKQIKAICDYLLGYWQFEVDEDEDDDKLFNDYFKNRYNVDLDNELNIGPNCWKGAHIELNNLLDGTNSELSKLLIGMVLVSSSRTPQNTERINILLTKLYKEI